MKMMQNGEVVLNRTYNDHVSGLSDEQLDKQIELSEGSWQVKLKGLRRHRQQEFEREAQMYAADSSKLKKLLTRITEIRSGK